MDIFKFTTIKSGTRISSKKLQIHGSIAQSRQSTDTHQNQPKLTTLTIPMNKTTHIPLLMSQGIRIPSHLRFLDIQQIICPLRRVLIHHILGIREVVDWVD